MLEADYLGYTHQIIKIEVTYQKYDQGVIEICINRHIISIYKEIKFNVKGLSSAWNDACHTCF